ncbi:Sulfatase [Paenibacillus sp. UNC496MF]|uniref:sulfatase family protein n=1 Tax=Paenibacillus sp. UNC496MF TaxID=1502753 RepID=UPI0008EFC0B1|nr:sulfatase-like hydrolase/transferase [Paenibacillus sp. UNC496MF]SFJ76366.1 Sulfatase [Paenibacillus sp. UNC496MF]
MKTGNPNILLIMTDQHRFDCLGATGNPDVKTPNIDRLAADGVIYDNCFCAAPFCTPSRYSFVTGLYPHQHHGKTNHSTIPRGTRTFPRELKLAGYRTKAVGKMHYTPTYLDVGFESMELAEQAGPGRFDDDYHQYLMEHGLADLHDLMDQVNEYRVRAPQHYYEQFGTRESDLPEEHYSTTWIGDRALDSLQAWEGEGNLLMVSFIKPHHPIDPPSPWSNMYDPRKLKPLPGWTEQCLERDLQRNRGFFPHEELKLETLQNAMALYYGSISQIDHHVGRLAQALQEKGMYEDTLILFTSDHGEYMGFHHMLLKSNYMYDPLSKIPLIIKFPGNRWHGIRRTELTSNVDIAPTLLRQCGIEAKDLPGKDLAAAEAERQYALSVNLNEYMLRSQTRKLIYSRNPVQRLFFNLETDPYEMNNLYEAPEYHDEVQSYIRKLSDMILFETMPTSHLDDEAPVVLEEDNKRNLVDKHKIAEEWYRVRMNNFLQGSEVGN